MTLSLWLLAGLMAHMVGDYVTQTQWMANEKVKRDGPAWVHAVVYSAPFYVLLALMVDDWVAPVHTGGLWDNTHGFWGVRVGWAFTVIVFSHFVIDRYRLAKYLCWAKNQVAPKTYRYPWSEAGSSGYHKDMPDWLAFWLMIIADNTVHVAINSAMIVWVYQGGR